MAKTAKGFLPGMIEEADQMIAKATAGMARVNESEVVSFLLKPIVVAIERHLQHTPRGNVFVLEVPFAPPWHAHVGSALEAIELPEKIRLFNPIKIKSSGGEETDLSNIFNLVPLLAALANDSQLAQEAAQKLYQVRQLIQEMLLQNKNIFLVAQRRENLPPDFEVFNPVVLRLSRFTTELFKNACKTYYDGLPTDITVGPDDLQWIRHIEPSDFLVNTSVADQNIVGSIRATVNKRLSQLASQLAPMPLEKFNGIDAIVGWAGELKAALVHPEASSGWLDVAHGALFQGHDALFVKEIAKAFADHCGFAFVSMSVIELAQAMQFHFDRAWTNAPAVLFIENSEVLQDTRRVAGQLQEQRQLAGMRDALLRQIDAFRPTEPVVVIGSTLAHEHIDSEYRLPGRLERVFIVPKPNQNAMAELFKVALHGTDHEIIGDDQFIKLGQFAGTLGDIRLIRLYVSHAARIAKKEKRKIQFEDLRDAMLRGTAEGGSDETHNERALEQVAYHEAGHAAIAILDSQGLQIPEYATIVPSPGKGGFVLRNLDSLGQLGTYRDGIRDIRLSLASRVVEELKYGMADVSSGAGGGPGSDLHKASMTALAMFGLLGFSANPEDPNRSGECVYVSVGDHTAWATDPVISANARKLLNDVYLDTRKTLQDNWALVQAIAERLISDDVLDAAALKKIYGEYQKPK